MPPYLLQSRRKTVGMVGPGTRGTGDEIFSCLFSTNQAMFDPCGFVDALKAVPVAVGDLLKRRLEAVRVVAFVTTGKQKKLNYNRR